MLAMDITARPLEIIFVHLAIVDFSTPEASYLSTHYLPYSGFITRCQYISKVTSHLTIKKLIF